MSVGTASNANVFQLFGESSTNGKSEEAPSPASSLGVVESTILPVQLELGKNSNCWSSLAPVNRCRALYSLYGMYKMTSVWKATASDLG